MPAFLAAFLSVSEPANCLKCFWAVSMKAALSPAAWGGLVCASHHMEQPAKYSHVGGGGMEPLVILWEHR